MPAQIPEDVLARPSQFGAVSGWRQSLSRVTATRDFESRCSEDLPTFKLTNFLSLCGCDVSAQHKSEKGWQGASLLQHRRESSAELGQDGTAHGSVSGRSQRPTSGGLAQELGGVRRRSAELAHSESVSRRPGNSPGCGRRSAGEIERTGAAAGACVRQLLASVRAVAPVEPGWFLATTTAGRTRSGELGVDFAVAEKDRLYRCLDRILEHKQELFVWLQQKWADLFHADFEVLLYDLTSTYFEGEMEENPKARHGYSRDGRPDCLQVVIALVITPDGFPLAYEVMDGNTSDRTTLRGFLDQIENTYGQAKRMWIMDRGIPSEAILAEMRNPARPMSYLVGTGKGKIKQYEKKWLDLPWHKVRDSVEVKLFEQDGELYVLAKSEGRQRKEIAMRRKRLARLLRKLRAMRRSLPSRDQLLMRIGAVKTAAGRAFGFVKIQVPEVGQPVTRESFRFTVDKNKLQEAELRDGHYLLRSNLTGADPAVLWTRYVQLTQIESAFRSLKSELGIRPIYHHLEHRVDAHILIAFLAYCLQVTLKNRLALH